MPSTDLSILPPEKKVTGLRVIKTYVRKNLRDTQYNNHKYISNCKIDNEYKNVVGQSVIGYEKKSGKWKILTVHERLV
jgi:hypothetical protein